MADLRRGVAPTVPTAQRIIDTMAIRRVLPGVSEAERVVAGLLARGLPAGAYARVPGVLRKLDEAEAELWWLLADLL